MNPNRCILEWRNSSSPPAVEQRHLADIPSSNSYTATVIAILSVDEQRLAAAAPSRGPHHTNAPNHDNVMP